MNEKVRLVAPAGDLQTLKAAVTAGADAVYVGTGRFSARAFAPNFSLDELKDAVDFAHLHGCEVYAAMNTLIKDSELYDALSQFFAIIRLGVDAVVMQDMGFIALSKHCMAQMHDHIPLLHAVPHTVQLTVQIFASTQTTAHSIESVEFLAGMGVSRVILARELSLSGMRAIAEHVKHHCGIGLEAFVHGALCISYSGQCLMSSFIGSRSGNRGRCSQPCRQKYTLVNHTKKGGANAPPPKPVRHLLSPRDMMLLEHICALIDSGITSFKIEGRMRRYEYVASAVFAYRQAIDACLSGKGVAYDLDAQKMNLEAVFTRGFTDYYLTGKGKLMQTKRPHNRGVRVGSVSDYNSGKSIAHITLTSPLRCDDGIRIESDFGDTGTLVREDATRMLSVRTESPVAAGDAVFRTYDVRVMRLIEEMVARPLTIGIHVKAVVEADKPLVIELSDKDGNMARAVSTILAQRADKKPMSQDGFEKQLLKFGDTPFFVESYDVHLGDDVFLPIKIINETRRQAVSALIQERVGNSGTGRTPEIIHKDNTGGGDEAADQCNGIEDNIRECIASFACAKHAGQPQASPVLPTVLSPLLPPLLIITVRDLDCGIRAISEGADCIYLTWEGRNHLEKLGEYARIHNIPLFLKTQHLIKDGRALREFLAGKRQFMDGIVAQNLTSVSVAKELGVPFVSDHHLNVFNSIAMKIMHDAGAVRVTASLELTLSEMGNLRGAPMECVVHGDVEVMVSESDILKIKGKSMDVDGGYTFGLVDEKGYEFPVFADEEGMTHVFNSKELCAISMIPGIIAAGATGLRVDAGHMKKEHVGTVTSYYRREMDEYLADPKGYRFRIERRKELETLSSGGFTRGHYLRGVD